MSFRWTPGANLWARKGLLRGHAGLRVENRGVAGLIWPLTIFHEEFRAIFGTDAHSAANASSGVARPPSHALALTLFLCLYTLFDRPATGRSTVVVEKLLLLLLLLGQRSDIHVFDFS